MTKEALKLALETLEDFADAIKYEHEQDDIGRRACCDELSYSKHSENCNAIKAITAIKEALAQPAQQEPAVIRQAFVDGAWHDLDKSSKWHGVPTRTLYTTPTMKP
jgi:hypothetical protein